MNAVNHSKLLEVVQTAGNQTEKRATSLKIHSKTAKGCQVYLRNPDKQGNVAIVELSNLELPLELGHTISAGEHAHGSVKQWLNTEGDEATVVARFTAVIDALNSLPPEAKPVRQRGPRQQENKNAPLPKKSEKELRRDRIMLRAEQLKNGGLSIGSAVAQAQAEYDAAEAGEPITETEPTRALSSEGFC